MPFIEASACPRSLNSAQRDPTHPGLEQSGSGGAFVTPRLEPEPGRRSFWEIESEFWQQLFYTLLYDTATPISVAARLDVYGPRLLEHRERLLREGRTR